MSGIDCFTKVPNLIVEFNEFPSDKLIMDIYQFISHRENSGNIS